MHPGFYVARRPNGRRMTQRVSLILESRGFVFETEQAREFAFRSAQNWRDFVQSEHKGDDVFVMEVFPNTA